MRGNTNSHPDKQNYHGFIVFTIHRKIYILNTVTIITIIKEYRYFETYRLSFIVMSYFVLLKKTESQKTFNLPFIG